MIYYVFALRNCFSDDITFPLSGERNRRGIYVTESAYRADSERVKTQYCSQRVCQTQLKSRQKSDHSHSPLQIFHFGGP
jgi:hypothetical protein